jgi:AcrR family transcriptional regulator
MIAGGPGLPLPVNRATLLTDESVKSEPPRVKAVPSPVDGAADGGTLARTPSLRQRRKAARPQELLDAALTLFVSKGLAATRSEDVARLAGVSKGTLYLYYPSKDELFKAVVRAHLTDVIVVGEDLLQRHQGTAAELLHALAQTWWQKVASSKAAGLLVLMLSEAKNFPELAQFYVDEVVAPSHALVAKAVQWGIDRGELRPMNVMMAVQALVAPMQFLVIYRECTSVCAVEPMPTDPESFMHEQIDILLQGLEARPRQTT